MNKKLLTLLTAVMCFMTASAEDFTVDGIKYTGDETTKTATVTGTEEGFSQTDVVIPEEVNGYKVTQIGDDAFWHNHSVVSLTMPNSVTAIGYQAFMRCRSLKTMVFSNTLETIGDDAFAGCRELKEIVLPNTVVAIGKEAFASTSIKTFVFPEKITEVAYGLFSSCDSLTTVVFPPTLKKIGKIAFWGAGLTSIEIPATTTEIEYYAIAPGRPFIGCRKLESIKVAEGNPVYDSRNNCNAIIETATNTLIVGCQNSTIPDGVTSIDSCSFYGMGLTSLDIPNAVTSIGYAAFRYSSLKNIEIPNSVNFIGEEAFIGCGDLASVKLPDGLKIIEDYTFNNCSQLKTVNMPTSLERIGLSAFRGCTLMKDIVFPNTLQKIGFGAFNNCRALTTIVIPASVSEIDENPFTNCYGLTSLSVAAGNTVYDSREDCNAIIETATNKLLTGCQTTVIPNSITAIGSKALASCGWTEVTIPAGITSIESGAFASDQLTVFTSLIEEPFAVSADAFGLNSSADNGKTLFIPKGLTNKYKATEGWNWFETILEIGDTNDGYLWTGDYEKGGHAEATDGVSVGYANAGYTTIRLNGKADLSTDYITLTLNEPIKAGDVISITAYRNKNAADKKSGVKMILCPQGAEGRKVTLASSTGLEFVNIDQSDASAGDSNCGTAPNTCQFTVPASTDKYDYIMMTRSHADTNLFITKIEINGNAASGIVQTQVDKNTDNALYDLKGSRLLQKPTQPGIYIRGGRKVVIK